jgi:hypothetical protein
MRRIGTTAAAAVLGMVSATCPAQEPEARTFKPGEMIQHVEGANGYCRQRGADAFLIGVDYRSAPEGSFYRARFSCGAQAPSDVLVTFRPEDFGRIKADLDGYCQKRSSAGANVTTEPAVSERVSKITFSCK